MFWSWRWCFLEEIKKFAENKKKNGKEFGWKEEIQMIICKRLAHPDDHFQKAGPHGWSFQKACQYGWSFSKGRPIRMIICKRPAHPDDHLQKATTATIPTTTSCVYHFSLSWISYNNIFIIISSTKQILKGRRFVDVDIFTKHRCFFREKKSLFSGAFTIESHFAKDFENRETIIIILFCKSFILRCSSAHFTTVAANEA